MLQSALLFATGEGGTALMPAARKDPTMANMSSALLGAVSGPDQPLPLLSLGGTVALFLSIALNVLLAAATAVVYRALTAAR